MFSKDFFNEHQKKKIVDAIVSAEKNTSGEIRVHIEKKCTNDAIIKAETIFKKLEMYKTASRNGILFYLAFDSKDFAVYGDKGIHEKVGIDFWNLITQKATIKFKENNYDEGLVDAILECGNQLKKYFPIQQNDINELSNEISFD